MSKNAVETVVVGAFPRVDLLPPSTREAIRRRPIVRRLLIGVAIIALVVGLAVAGSVLLALTANVRLQAERDRSELLLSQQLEFADARSIANALDESVAARQVAVASEVDWNALIGEIRETLPDGVLLTSVDGSVEIDDPDESAPQGEPEPLRQNSIGSFRISATSPTVPDVEAWLDRLESITGFAGIAPPVSVVGSDGASYTVTIEVLLNEEAFLGRFAEAAPSEEEEG